MFRINDVLDQVKCATVADIQVVETAIEKLKEKRDELQSHLDSIEVKKETNERLVSNGFDITSIEQDDQGVLLALILSDKLENVFEIEVKSIRRIQ